MKPDLGRSLAFVATAVFAVLVTAVGCTRQRDRFWPDSENGLLALSELRIVSGNRERLIFLQQTRDPGEYSAIERLAHTLRVGDRVVVSVTVSVDGEYTLGGGWVFSGRTYTGLHGVAGDLLAVTTSRPNVVAAAADDFGNLELGALTPGEAVVTLSATMSRRYADRPEDSPTLTDTVVFVVED